MDPDVLASIGTPLVAVDGPDGAQIAAKLEGRNPGGSAKVRPATWIVEAAESDGRLEPGDRIVEATSGNTGIGLAIVAAVKGYDLTVVMPADKSSERSQIMAAYGADVTLVEGDMADAREHASELAAERGATRLDQFSDPANWRAHYETTGAEILDQVGRRGIDAFVAPVGTGGTIMGVGRRLRETNPGVTLVGVEPAENAVLSGEDPGKDAFQGMGPGFVSDLTDPNFLNRVETVSLPEAEAASRELAREAGILAGQSSGAALVAARRVARDIADPTAECPEVPGEGFEAVTDGGDCPLVVTVFPDDGARYLSTGLFDRD